MVLDNPKEKNRSKYKKDQEKQDSSSDLPKQKDKGAVQKRSACRGEAEREAIEESKEYEVNLLSKEEEMELYLDRQEAVSIAVEIHETADISLLQEHRYDLEKHFDVHVQEVIDHLKRQHIDDEVSFNPFSEKL